MFEEAFPLAALIGRIHFVCVVVINERKDLFRERMWVLYAAADLSIYRQPRLRSWAVLRFAASRNAVNVGENQEMHFWAVNAFSSIATNSDFPLFFSSESASGRILYTRVEYETGFHCQNSTPHISMIRFVNGSIKEFSEKKSFS